MKLRALKFPYAYKEGMVVHISSVESGRNCGCYFEINGEKHPVVAKKGQIRRHHFSPSSSVDFSEIRETMYHVLAKQLLSEQRQVQLPRLSVEMNDLKYLWILRESKVASEFIVRNEALIGNGPYIGDSIVEFKTSKKEQLVIEWVVTHPCEREKIATLKRNHIASIEVYLGTDMDSLSQEECRQWILFKAPRKWIWHPAMVLSHIKRKGFDLVRRETYSAVRFYTTRVGVKSVDALWVKNCPDARKVVSIRRCAFCPYAYKIEHWQSGYVDCAGSSAQAVKQRIRERLPDLSDLRQAVYDGSDWYERATPNLGNGFRKGWDKPRGDLVDEVRAELIKSPYSNSLNYDVGFKASLAVRGNFFENDTK